MITYKHIKKYKEGDKMQLIHNKRQYLYYFIGLIIPINYLLFASTSFLYKTYISNTQIVDNLYFTFIIFANISIKQLSLNMFPAIFYCRKLQKRSIIKTLRLNLISKKQLLYSSIIFVLYNIISAILIILQEDVLKLFNLNFVMDSQPIATTIFATIMFVLAGGIICPISEEFFFRGLLIRGMEKLGIKFAIFISAFYFAIYHNNPYRMITLLLFGVLIGYIVHYTNSILPGILFHILTNSIFVISSYVQGPDNYNKLYNDISSVQVKLLENNYVLGIVLVISSVICLWYLKKLKNLSITKDLTIDTVDNRISTKWKIHIVTSLIIVTLLFIAIAM